MTIRLFHPSEDSLLCTPGFGRSARSRAPQWFPVLMLVWSIWIFITPLYQTEIFLNWKWPTLASYAVFLLLYHHAYYRTRAHLFACAMGIALLGFVVTPFNPGAQGYLIYACAFLAFCARPRLALAWMLGLLALYTAEWLVLGWHPLYLASAVVVGLAVGVMNISINRKAQADAALSLSHDEVRRLAALAERERIGRDLHDLLGHTLSLVALKSDLAGKLLERDPVAAKREVDEVSRVAREALAQVRSAVTGIRTAGMAAELASARLLLECDGVAFHCDADEHMATERLPRHVESVLALTVREAATNIQRHARARVADVALRVEGDLATLRVSDDGRGGAIVPGNGLDGMRERIEALGGSLRIDSTVGGGTRLVVSLPLAANDDAFHDPR